MKPSSLMKLALEVPSDDETRVLEFATNGSHFFAVKRLQILAEVCQESALDCPSRPLRQLLDLLGFELGNIATELHLEDETAQFGRVN